MGGSLRWWLLLISLSVCTVRADTAVTELAQRIIEEQPVDASLERALAQTPKGMFALAWLYENGVYGVSLDGEKAYALYQQAAERGEMDAAHYCWWRCLHFTPELIDALEAAAEQGDPQGLYLHAQWLIHQKQQRLELANEQLLAAARKRHPEAISELYLRHFLEWSADKHAYELAQDKLQRCSREGVVVCYLLLGALHQRHGYSQEALLNYLILQQLDYGMFRQYLSAGRLAALERRLPSNSRLLLEARVATRLAHHPETGFDVLDRFRICAEDVTYDCIQTLVKRDQHCMLGYFSDDAFAGVRQSRAYRRCMGFE